MTKSQKSSRKRMAGRSAGKWAWNTRVVKQQGAKVYRDLLIAGLKAKAEDEKV